MKNTLLILLVILFTSYTCNSQTVRKYFFNDNLSINDSTSLVLIVKEPQTQFAKELNHRIYEDTNFIKQLKSDWFIETSENLIRTGHNCGHDLFFYSLSGTEYHYLNRLNSNCEISEVGCTNLNVLLQSGRALRVDTLLRIPLKAYKKDIFNDNLIEAYYENRQEWENCKTRKYPVMYYDGVFRTKIYLDSNFSIYQNAENFIRTQTYDIKGINWNISGSYSYSSEGAKIKLFEQKKIPCEVEIAVYLKSEKFHLFNNYDIEKIDFSLKRGSNLLLFYKN